MTERIIIEKSEFAHLLGALGLEYVETEHDFQICMNDGNDSMFYLDFITL